MSAALAVKDLGITFGGIRAISGLDLKIETGSIFGLIGPNGAGKTTVFNLLSGIYAPDTGSIELLGKPITGLKPHLIARRGLARTFQNIRLFKDLDIETNVRVALDQNAAAPRGKAQAQAKVKALLDLCGVSGVPGTLARELPYGRQRRLEIARALATGAQVLLLDEPAAGLNPSETASLLELIRKLRDQFGLTLLMIEHDMKLVMGVCERIAVLDYGIKIAEGTPADVRVNPKVIEAYLGPGASA